MSPEQIDAVVTTWDLAGRDPGLLLAAVAARLPAAPGDGRARRERARWIVDAVSQLSPALDRPTTLGPAAAAVITRRAPVTLAELADDREALVGALRTTTVDFGPVEEQAWEAALELFAEVVAGLCLDPFGARPGPGGERA